MATAHRPRCQGHRDRRRLLGGEKHRRYGYCYAINGRLATINASTDILLDNVKAKRIDRIAYDYFVPLVCGRLC